MTDLPKQVHTALSALEDAGFEAFLVGGCVRDALRGQAPLDYDVTTNALPEQVEAVFRSETVIETGMRHGTVTVLLDGLPLEITTYRRDLGYSDGRHPDAVAFTPRLEDDLARRDFTVNAMAWNPQDGLVDCFGGQADLKRGLLRCVGDPAIRFAEDALRILRLLRFRARLGFAIEDQTAQAALASRENLQRVSAERIQKELTALLLGDVAGDVLTEYVEIFGVFLPELLKTRGFLQHNPHHAYDVLTHLARTVDAVPAEPVLRLAALLHDIAKPDCFTRGPDGIGHFYGHAKKSAAMADGILRRLRYDNETRRQTVELIEAHDLHLDPPTPKTVQKALRRLGPEQFFRLIALRRADNLGRGVDHPERLLVCDRAEAAARELLSQHAAFSLRDLALNGDDLIRLGIPAGPEIGRTLQDLLDAVLDGSVENNQAALLAWVKQQREGSHF